LLNNHRALPVWSGKYNSDEGYLIGLLLGDGTLGAEKAVLSAWETAAVANGEAGGISSGAATVMARALQAAQSLPHRADFAGWQQVSGRGEQRLVLAAVRDLAFELGMRPGHKQITADIEKASSAFYQGLLRGLFDADGSVQGSQQKGVSIRLAQSNLEQLQAVQRMLLRLGIASRIYQQRRASASKHLPDGKGGLAVYQIRAQHELVISGDNLLQFQQQIGFADSDKAVRLQNLLNSY